MTEETTLRLKKPLTIEGNVIEQLTLREPTAGEIINAEEGAKTGNGIMVRLIGLVSGRHPNVINQLGARDYTAASEYLNSFLKPAPETGES